MRLINADSLLANMDRGMQGPTREFLKFYRMAVDDEPTACDMDKIMERLDDKALEHAITGQQYGEDGYGNLEMLERAKKQGIEEAAEIVKSYGIR